MELSQSQRGERAVDDGRNLGVIDDRQHAVADDVDVGLIELAETPALCAFAPIDFANLVPPEREGQFMTVQGDVFRKRYRQVEAERQVGVALLETVNLLFGLPAAFREQDFRRLH